MRYFFLASLYAILWIECHTHTHTNISLTHTFYNYSLMNLRIKYKRNIYVPASKTEEIQEQKPL